MARPVNQMPIRHSEYREQYPLQGRMLDRIAQLLTCAALLDETAVRLRTEAVEWGRLSEETRGPRGSATKKATAPDSTRSAA